MLYRVSSNLLRGVVTLKSVISCSMTKIIVKLTFRSTCYIKLKVKHMFSTCNIPVIANDAKLTKIFKEKVKL